MSQGLVHSLESFGSADGPGVRFLVFLKGCNLRCSYCHNPDTWAKTDDVQHLTAEEVLAKALRYREYWGDKGGITVSGGEPLLQIDFVTELFELAKAKGVTTCIDTAAEPFSCDPGWLAKFERLMKVTDTVLLDVKHIDSDEHRKLTGRPNDNILDCARWLSEHDVAVWIRHVLVPGVNSDEATLTRTAEFLRTLRNVKRVDILPYHTLGVFKWKELGIPYRLEGVKSPTREEMELARRIVGSCVSV